MGEQLQIPGHPNQRGPHMDTEQHTPGLEGQTAAEEVWHVA